MEKLSEDILELYAVIESGIPAGQWSRKPFEGATKLTIAAEDFEDFNDTEGGIFEVVGGKAVRKVDKQSWLLQRQQRQQKEQRLDELLIFLSTDWWQRSERFHREQKEIEMGIRLTTTEPEEQITLAWKNATDEIDRLKEELGQK